MSEYRLEVNGVIGLSDYSSINDYMGIIGDDDKLTITFGASETPNVDIVTNILSRKGFQVAFKGGNDDGKYYITAYKHGEGFK